MQLVSAVKVQEPVEKETKVDNIEVEPVVEETVQEENKVDSTEVEPISEETVQEPIEEENKPTIKKKIIKK